MKLLTHKEFDKAVQIKEDKKIKRDKKKLENLIEKINETLNAGSNKITFYHYDFPKMQANITILNNLLSSYKWELVTKEKDFKNSNYPCIYYIKKIEYITKTL